MIRASVNRLSRSFRKTRYVVYKQTLINPKDHFWTFIGAFFGIGIIGFTHSKLFPDQDAVFLIGSFGASAVLIYGAPNSPLAQPRNLIGGHVASAFVGVTIHYLIPNELWISAALSVATSIVIMQITKTMHPPGGATALIANIGSAKILSLGYFYVLTPVLTSVLILFTVALIVYNIPANRSYPAKK